LKKERKFCRIRSGATCLIKEGASQPKNHAQNYYQNNNYPNNFK